LAHCLPVTSGHPEVCELAKGAVIETLVGAPAKEILPAQRIPRCAFEVVDDAADGAI